jgi:hypothetical protein
MTPLIFCFVMGGLVVSLFAILGDLLKPKSFAGLFWRGSFGCLSYYGSNDPDGWKTVRSSGKSFHDCRCRGFLLALLRLHTFPRSP